MKIFAIITTIIVLAVVGFIAYNHFSWEVYASDGYKAPADGLKSVEISELKTHPEKYKDTMISTQGTISLECPTGCWFYMKGADGADIKVELAYSNFAIPQAAGKKVRVEGKPAIENDQLQINGEKVYIK